MSKPQQLVFYGAPGTGKSYAINREAGDRKQIRVTIHPEYTYSDFAGQLLPRSDEDGNVHFSFVPGPFTEALMYAFDNREQEVVLILEELSRGNVAAIFGDLFQLLDRNSDTWNSAYPVHNSQIASCLPEIEENVAARTPENIFLPANLSIFATVNTSDQNVMPMDTAFKRRFDWQYVPTAPRKSDSIDTEYLNNPTIVLTRNNGVKVDTDWVKLYQSVNDYILSGNSPLGVNEDKQVGQFFIKFDDSLVARTAQGDTQALSEVLEILANKLLMYLWEDVEGRSGLAGAGVKRLFLPDISSFGELNERAKDSQVFSDFFFDEYLDK